MSTTLQLDEAFVQKAKRLAAENQRTLGQQIQHMATIGQIIIDNPDLSFAFIKEALEAKEEIVAGDIYEYARRS